MIPVILLASRAGGRYLACLAATGLLCVLLPRHGLKIQVAMAYPAVVMGVPEMCTVLLTTVGAMLLRPRMWIIDRLGTPRRRWVPATGAALATAGGPQFALALAAATGLRRDAWLLSATTLLFLAGLTILVSPFIDELRASGLTLLLYVALTITTQLAPAIGAWSPLAVVTWPEAGPLPPGKVALAAATIGAALGVTVRTLGRTMRTWGRDLT